MKDAAAATPARYGYAIYALATFAVVALGALGTRRGWALERELFWVRASGWCALSLLLSALSATPVGKILRRLGRSSAQVAPIRRALGIGAAALATLHGAISLSTYLAGSLDRVLELVWVRAGLLAWAILAALWLTSYPALVRRARIRVWKPLHRLAYVAALFALQHTLLAPLAPREWVLATFGAAIAIGLLRLLPARR